jgi:hypothetical protein
MMPFALSEDHATDLRRHAVDCVERRRRCRIRFTNVGSLP